MKKFKFSLDTVLNYKNQLLEELKREHGKIISAIMRKEAEIRALEGDCRKYGDAFNAEKEKGMSIVDALSYEAHICGLQHKMKKECEKLEALRIEESTKRKQVIAAKTETASFEKLKEKRMEEYRETVQKLEGRLVEEFVANKTASQSQRF